MVQFKIGYLSPRFLKLTFEEKKKWNRFHYSFSNGEVQSITKYLFDRLHWLHKINFLQYKPSDLRYQDSPD